MTMFMLAILATIPAISASEAIAARVPVRAAILMFLRCTSVVIGSPRRNSALPPRAITIVIASLLVR
ncbi:MAG TPA: hypothetical protein VIY52_21430 [Streptosporangiaceae bacterium]